jgi:HCOMODA/2-hydroxy-3-carboxy-muconic semialdehyde decarboxylase
MRGHGSTTAGGSIELAVYRAIYAEANAKLQTQALLLSGGDDKINYLTLEEAALAQASTEGQVARCWNLWVREIDTAGKA